MAESNGPVPLSEISDITQLIKKWEEEHVEPSYDPIPILTRMAEVVETEFENFMKVDPDPFDERHPSRADPNSLFGQVLKVIFKKDAFMDTLVSNYLRDNYWGRMGFSDRDDKQLNIAACRLIIDVMPGLEASAVFQTPDADGLIMRLFNWAERAEEPLQSYAIGLLAAAMEIQDTAAVFREQNTKFVPLMLDRLRNYQREAGLERQLHQRPFAHLNHENTPAKKKVVRRDSACSSPRRLPSPPPLMSPPSVDTHSMDKTPTPVKSNGLVKNRHNHLEVERDGGNHNIAGSDCSNSSWAEMENYVVPSLSIYPLTLSTKQMLILRYLTPMGEYQEFLSHVFEYNALSIILNYMNIRETKETRLGFEALKYLAALLCHKKVSIEFINMNGLQSLLEVPKPSVAATGVSICFYYLAYCEDSMEKICLAPKYVLSELVSYALWLLECSHNSGRCHATMFFGLSFQFRVILDEFDAQDGLRKLYNVISTLPILSIEGNNYPQVLNEDEQCSYRQIVRHVMVALKRYYEAHLFILANYYAKNNSGTSERGLRADLPPYKANRSTPEEVQEQIETLLELMPVQAPWPCVDQFLRLGGITLLLQIIALSYEWNFSGRDGAASRIETVQSALNVLAICAVKPEVQLVFTERLDLPDLTMSVGMNIILGSCEGEVVPDPDVQKAALQVIIVCVCAPCQRMGSSLRSSSAKDPIQKVWASVRENNGIIVLLMLMMVKTPITDADAMRALACRALAGLARCEKVRQIISKLPFLSNGSMQDALRDPILQEKRQEHVQFQKYYFNLIELIAGKHQRTSCDDVSLINIHRANVVAQTKIQYNKTQLYQLIHQQLTQDGLTDIASSLQKELGLVVPRPSTPSVTFPPSRIIMARPTVKTPQSTTPRSLFPASVNSTSTNSVTTPSSPIRLSLNKRESRTPNYGTPNRSLQKQTSFDNTAATSGVVPKAPQAILPAPERVSLHSIVTGYLTNQHALCKHPMVTCPQFNLFVPHKCPEPKSRREAPINHVMRLTKRQGGFHVTDSLDIRLTHSRFCPEKTIRLNSDDGFYTCSEFLPSPNCLALGTYHGEVRLFNLPNGVEDGQYQCHESSVHNIELSRKGDLMLTSSSWRKPLSALWGMNAFFELKQNFEDQDYVEFSKLIQDRIVGTNNSTATVYDVETGTTVITLTPRLSNTYSKNRATFNPTDELILTDGVLFDTRSGTEVHKLDKLNSVLSGVFHPNGLEILSNTEIWDLRTFHLQRTVPALDHQHVVFNSPGTVIYTYSVEPEHDVGNYESSFKTLDARTYTSIATIDVKKEIYHVACNNLDTQIAVVENMGSDLSSVNDTTVRIYDVGRRRDQDDEVEEEDDDMSDDGSNSGSNSDENSGNGYGRLAELFEDVLDQEIGDFPENGDDSDEQDPEFVAMESDEDGDNDNSSSSFDDDDDDNDMLMDFR